MKIHLILLAAGLSRRYGREDKLLSEREGKPLYRHTLDKLIPLGHPITVVCNAPEIRQYCDAHAIPWTASPLAEQGISHSLRAGLTAAGEGDAYVCFVADQPKLRQASIARLLEECQGRKAPLGCVARGERWGNPVWFGREFLPELMALEGDTGGKAVLRRHREAVVTVPVFPEELDDVDTPSCIW